MKKDKEGDEARSDLRRISFYALEQMTLTEFSEKYFDGRIGYVKRFLAREVGPVQAMAEIYAKRFEEKYHKRLAADKKRDKEWVGW